MPGHLARLQDPFKPEYLPLMLQETSAEPPRSTANRASDKVGHVGGLGSAAVRRGPGCCLGVFSRVTQEPRVYVT